MKSFSGGLARLHFASRIHPALTSFADEVCATIARLFAYVGTLAVLGILAVHGWDQLQDALADEPAPRLGWSTADRSSPAFAASQGSRDKSAVYTIIRHPLGGSKDILRWAGMADKVAAELEIYRPGGEFDPARGAGLAARTGAAELETTGVLDSKFGTVSLLWQAGRAQANSCLAFFKRIDDPALQISGFSCQGDGLAARRVAIGCMLDRLNLLASGHEAKLAELFAQAELKRVDCGAAGAEANWMTSAENPQLRGAF